MNHEVHVPDKQQIAYTVTVGTEVNIAISATSSSGHKTLSFNILQWENGEHRVYISELLQQNNMECHIYWMYLFSLSFIHVFYFSLSF